MPKYWPYVLAAVVFLFIVAVVGYVWPGSEPAVPVKVLLPSSNAEAVVFTHEAHVDQYDVDCAVCHHESPDPRPDPQPCGSCHGVVFDEDFAKNHIASFAGDRDACITCHHVEFVEPIWTREMHDEHAEFYASDCTDCHHTEDIEPEPQSCMDCHETIDENGHMPPVDPDMPVFRDAVHERCASCHQEWFDDGLEGCSSCHNPASTRELLKDVPPGQRPDWHFSECAACHYQEDMSPQDLMLPRDQAFHTQCMRCHEEADKGPYAMPPEQVRTQQDKTRHCAQCHTG